MKKSVYRAPSDEDPIEAVWEHDAEEDEESKIFIGKVRVTTLPPFFRSGAYLEGCF